MLGYFGRDILDSSVCHVFPLLSSSVNMTKRADMERGSSRGKNSRQISDIFSDDQDSRLMCGCRFEILCFGRSAFVKVKVALIISGF